MIIETVRGSVVGLGVSVALCGAAMAQYSPYQQPYPNPQQQYAAQPQSQGFGAIQTYPYNPAPAAPASWSYNPYTSGMTKCLNRDRGEERCADRIQPTAGQPNYWVRCNTWAGMSGAQADAACHQSAIKQAYEYAFAQQRAIEAQVAQQAASQAGTLNLPASAYEPVSVDYTTPSDNRHRRVTVKRLASFSEPASRQICDTFTRIEADLDSGASSSATARRCKGADGQWHEA
jgi:hypothetical protein